MSGDAIWKGNEATHEGRRATLSTHVLRRGAERGEGRRRRGSVSGDTIWRGDEERHEARRAARSTHPLRRGAERDRWEAEEGQRERRCVMVRRRGNARGTARGAVDSHAASRRRAGARGGGGGAA